MLRCCVVIACLGLLSQPAGSSSQPSTALITGRVVDAASGAPIAGAIVSLSGAALGSSLAPRLLTDPQGRFLYRNLPAGTFRLTAVKPGFADGAFGRRRPAGPPQDLELSAGQRATDVTITLWKFAVISGTVYDEAGEPVVGAPVSAWRRARIGGRAVLRPVGTRPATDDRGIYRVSNVPPGEYLVGIEPRNTSLPGSVADALRTGGLDPAARSELTSAMMTAGRAGTVFTGPAVSRVGEQIVTFVDGLAVPGSGLPAAVYPPTYHPAAPSPERAETITVASGEDRAGVDIQLQPVSASSISGTIMGPDGPAAHLAVRLDASTGAGLRDTGGAGTVTDANGAFSFVAVPAGSYTLRATRVPRSPAPQRESVATTVGDTTLVVTTEGPGPPAPLPTEPTLWAALPVQTGGDPIGGLVVTLQPGSRFAGRIEFEGSSARPQAEELQRIRIMPTPLDGFAPSGNRPAHIEPDTGTVLDHLGQPMPGVPISLRRYAFSSTTGQRDLSMAASGRTDDRGVYRLYALPPGEYLVSASWAREAFLLFREEPELVQVSEADVNQILLDAQRSVPGAPDASPETASMAPGLAVDYARLYFPNAISASQATPLRLAAGDERSGIDFQMSLVPTARVEGVVSMLEGTPPAVVLVTMFPADDPASGRGWLSTRTGEDGHFRFASVMPGEYTLTARANDPAVPGSDSSLWAAAPIAAVPGTTTTVSLELRRGFTVSGRVEFATSESQPPPLKGWRVGLAPDGATGRPSLGAGTTELQADGSFTIRGLSPGQYRLRGFPPAAVAKGWIVRSAVQTGRDLLDSLISISSDTADITLTFTDRVAGIGGTLQDATGAPADYYIIVFPRSPAQWWPQSPRIQAIRPSADGKYEVGGLPAGDYFLVATTDVEQGEWWDTAFLQRMAASAMAFTLAEGERKVQDLQLPAGR